KYFRNPQLATLELTQEMTSATGQSIKRTTIFNRTAVRAPEPQVLAHVLSDSKDKLICRAIVHKVTADRDSGAIVPSKVTIECPEQKVAVDLMLPGIELNIIAAQLAGRLFSRADLSQYASYALAKGLVTPTAGIRRASGTAPVQQR